MRSFIIAGAVLGAVCTITLQASILPTFHLDSATIKYFQDYVAEFEGKDLAAFNSAGKLWIDDEAGGKKAAFDAGKPVVEARQNKDIPNGSIHHFSGVIRIAGGTIDAVQQVMRDYPNYGKYFRPDVTSATGEQMPDSTPADRHYHAHLLITQSTLWINVGYLTSYDTHYMRLDPNRWVSRSISTSIKELLDPTNTSGGTYPEGDDHGFLWKTNTYWFARQREGGLDLEANSISVSRPAPMGFGWWGTKRAHEAVDKMLTDIKAAISKK